MQHFGFFCWKLQSLVVVVLAVVLVLFDGPKCFGFFCSPRFFPIFLFVCLEAEPAADNWQLPQEDGRWRYRALYSSIWGFCFFRLAAKQLSFHRSNNVKNFATCFGAFVNAFCSENDYRMARLFQFQVFKSHTHKQMNRSNDSDPESNANRHNTKVSSVLG